MSVMPLKAILMDADGVLWRGRQAVPGAAEFVKRAKAAGLRCILVSNNAGPNREAYSDKCQRLGLDFAAPDIFSVNHLAGPYLARHHPGASVFVIGSEMLTASMREHVDAVSADEWLAQRGAAGRAAEPGDLKLLEQASFEIVMVGIDVNVNYLKLSLASVLTQRGALLLAANPDYSFPYAGGVVLPGNGSIVTLIAQVSGAEPHYIGKPSLYLLEQIEEETGIGRGEMVMVGDRLETDVAFAHAAGMPAYLVLTGVATRADAEESELPLTIVADPEALAVELGLP